jgi:very-short-patch-repair endonuclease
MSKLEEKFVSAWSQYGAGRIPATQHRFTLKRRFRFDFAWPKERVAVECDGFGLGGFAGAHQSIVGLSNSHEKANLAQECGWIVLRYTSRQLGSDVKRELVCQQIVRILRRRQNAMDQRQEDDQ